MPSHFSEAALRFLSGLKKNNDRDWFNARKAIYEAELKKPMMDLIGEINQGLLQFAPEHVRPPQKALLRIYRDTRFGKDKRPYKTHLSAWWGRPSAPKTTGAGFYLSISGTEILMGAGAFMPNPEQLLAIRRHLVGSHEELARHLSARQLRGLLLPADGMPLSRPPKGFAQEAPGAQTWLRCRRWGATATLPASDALLPNLSREILKRFRAGAPLVQLLNDALIPRPNRPMF